LFLFDEGRGHLFPCDSGEDLYNAARDPKEFWMVPRLSMVEPGRLGRRNTGVGYYLSGGKSLGISRSPLNLSGDFSVAGPRF
jgi:hypothetical protein